MTSKLGIQPTMEPVAAAVCLFISGEFIKCMTKRRDNERRGLSKLQKSSLPTHLSLAFLVFSRRCFHARHLYVLVVVFDLSVNTLVQNSKQCNGFISCCLFIIL